MYLSIEEEKLPDSQYRKQNQHHNRQRGSIAGLPIFKGGFVDVVQQKTTGVVRPAAYRVFVIPASIRAKFYAGRDQVALKALPKADFQRLMI